MWVRRKIKTHGILFLNFTMKYKTPGTFLNVTRQRMRLRLSWPFHVPTSFDRELELGLLECHMSLFTFTSSLLFLFDILFQHYVEGPVLPRIPVCRSTPRENTPSPRTSVTLVIISPKGAAPAPWSAERGDCGTPSWLRDVSKVSCVMVQQQGIRYIRSGYENENLFFELKMG